MGIGLFKSVFFHQSHYLPSLSCRFVSTGDGPSHPKLHRYVHSGHGKGFLAALLAMECPSWSERFASTTVSAEERQALRTMLLQVGFAFL